MIDCIYSGEFLNVLHIVLGSMIIIALVIDPLLDLVLGKEKMIPKLEEISEFHLRAKKEDELIIAATLPFANEGRQCGTIMDAILRVQLPFEQYDGIDARGKVELQGKPREDDYFEAVLIQKGERLYLDLVVSLRPRRGLTLDEALVAMVDVGLDLIYQETGRTPCSYQKARLELKATDVARLAGVELRRA